MTPLQKKSIQMIFIEYQYTWKNVRIPIQCNDENQISNVFLIHIEKQTASFICVYIYIYICVPIKVQK
jgi:hypothetical protein